MATWTPPVREGTPAPAPAPSTAPAPRSETIIGDGVTFKGELAFKGSLIVEGTFEGNVASKGTLLVRKSGLVVGEVQVARVRVEGKVRGNISASERIDLAATADLQGDVQSPVFAMAHGAVFIGKCQIGGAAPKDEQGA